MKKLLPINTITHQTSNQAAATVSGNLSPLTSKERSVLDFIETELRTKGISPSYQEICDHFGFASFNSVQNYLKQLSQKGYVQIPQNQKRAIHLIHSAQDFHRDLNDRLNGSKEPSKSSFFGQSSNPITDHEHSSKVLAIPFLGRVAAGSPIERVQDNEFMDVPINMMKTPGDYFALKVEGDSMIEEGIFDGDFLVVLSQKAARDGDLVVASIDDGATVKRFFHKKNPQIHPTEKLIELRPANPNLTSMWYQPQQVELKGLVKALLRKY
jgi:repressor LexA